MMRRRCFGVAGLLVVALVAGSASAPAAVGAQTEPSDGIQVTRLMTTDGRVLQGGLEVTEGGHVLASWSTAAVYVWRDGQATQLNVPPWWEFLRPRDISNHGHVVGGAEIPLYNWLQIPIGAFVWQDGQLTPMHPWWDEPASSPFATSINDRGQVVMWYLDLAGARRLAVADAAGQTTLSPEGIQFMPGSYDSGDWDSIINERGQVAFNMRVGGLSFRSHAAIWDVATGQVTDLGTLGGDTSTLQDINGLGMVTGTSTTADGEEHAFFWHNGEMTDLGTLGGDSSTAVDINEWGQVVGASTAADGEQHGFMWYAGQTTEIEPFGGTTVTPSAINNWGQVVGTSTTDEGQEAAFLWQNGRSVNLGDAADAGWSEAVDINDRGQILGDIGRLIAGAGGSVLWTVSPLWGYKDDPASDLAAARKRWDENRPDTYRVTITQSCFCLDEVTEPRTVTVTGDEVTDVDPPIPDDIGFELEPLTIGALFGILERAVVEADELNVTYNEAYGFPESIDIDWIEDAVDDEVSYTAQSFEELEID